MKTIEQVLTEMIMENKKEIKKTNEDFKKDIENVREFCENWRDGINHYQDKYYFEFRMFKKSIKKITLLIILATLANSISIIILNLWR